jgi:CRISPR-associated protein Csb2
MPSLTIGWEYLTGYAVATDPGNRNRAEWPPHPGRLFMALAAAWFETGVDPAEGEALRWLETLDDPELFLPQVEPTFERSNVTVYVPVNDRAGPSAATLQSAPAMPRSKQPRMFPRVWVGDGPCFMHWTNATGADQHSVWLDRLCWKVTRIGHSSSLVRMWVADGEQSISGSASRWISDEELAQFQVRRVSSGTLDMLAERFNGPARERHAALSEQIEALALEKKIKGSGARERKAEIDKQIQELISQRDSLNARPALRPSLGLWSGYRRGGIATKSERPHAHFDTDVLILSQVAGPQLPLISTLAVTKAMRGTVMKYSDVQPAPSWVSGHFADGQPVRDDEGHLGFIPLPFVGRKHADGHLLGVGLVFPRSVERRDRARALSKLLVEPSSRQAKPIELTLGRLGVWSVAKCDWSEQRLALRPETWTAYPHGDDTWASVTPVVLDRFPKTDRGKNRADWTQEVGGIVVEACTRIGLPQPIAVDIDTTSWHLGSPRAVRKRRPVRNHLGVSDDDNTSLGDGFPPFPAKGTKVPRPQVHVWLRFSERVVGPILLGAGRYLGYGLLKPWAEGRHG